MVGKFQGKLIGVRDYEKDGKKVYIYEIFCEGKKDSATGLYNTECSIIRVFDDKELPNAKFNMPVEFYGEQKTSKNGTYLSYSDISAVGK